MKLILKLGLILPVLAAVAGLGAHAATVPNGLVLNGLVLNGLVLNGLVLNGERLTGQIQNGGYGQAASAMTVSPSGFNLSGVILKESGTK
jgi:hypothetical protein